MADEIPVEFRHLDKWEVPTAEPTGRVVVPAGTPVAKPVLPPELDGASAADLAEYQRLWEATRCKGCRHFDRDRAKAEVVKDVARTALMVELQFKAHHFDVNTVGYCSMNSTPDAPLFTTPDASCDNFQKAGQIVSLGR